MVVPVGMAPAVKPPAQPNVHLQLWGRFDEPIDFVTRNGQSGMVYVAEKAGQVIRTDGERAPSQEDLGPSLEGRQRG